VRSQLQHSLCSVQGISTRVQFAGCALGYNTRALHAPSPNAAQGGGQSWYRAELARGGHHLVASFGCDRQVDITTKIFTFAPPYGTPSSQRNVGVCICMALSRYPLFVRLFLTIMACADAIPRLRCSCTWGLSQLYRQGLKYCESPFKIIFRTSLQCSPSRSMFLNKKPRAPSVAPSATPLHSILSNTATFEALMWTEGPAP
jgi:hypothetical protein